MPQTPTTTSLQRAWLAINSASLAAHTAGVQDRAAGRAPLVPAQFTVGDQRLAWNDGYHGRQFESLTDAPALLSYLDQEGQS
jgi:hypothetical protein